MHKNSFSSVHLSKAFLVRVLRGAGSVFSLQPPGQEAYFCRLLTGPGGSHSPMGRCCSFTSRTVGFIPCFTPQLGTSPAELEKLKTVRQPLGFAWQVTGTLSQEQGADSVFSACPKARPPE